MLLAPLCVFQAVYECLMFLIRLFGCVCVCALVCLKPPGQSLFHFFVMWLLIRRHLIVSSPSEGLVEAAISTQRSPTATRKAFYLALGCFFLINTSIHLPLKPNCLICIFFRNKPAIPHQSLVFWCFFCFPPQWFSFTCRFKVLLWKVSLNLEGAGKDAYYLYCKFS